MKNNKDILSLFKDGHGITEIQSLLEQNGYPFVKQRSLGKKNLKKSNLISLALFQIFSVFLKRSNLLHQKQLNKNISNSVHYVRSSNQGTRPFTEK